VLEELYQEIIMDHYRRPRNKGRANPVELEGHETNPLCGDDIVITASLKDGHLHEVKFDGKGCAICIASASIMTQKLAGKPLDEAQTFITSFQNMMRGEIPFGGKELGDLKALEGVLKFPVRVKCATLAWQTMKSAIERKL
jgi:nitrogen fixation NifU-like protein